MPFEALFAHFGVSTYTGLVGTLQPALGEAYAQEASQILTAGDETAAQNFLDRVVAETPAEELMRKLGGGNLERGRSPAAAIAMTRHPLLYPPRSMHAAAHSTAPAEAAASRPAQWFLHNALNFAELTLELKIQHDRKDADAAVTFLEAAGVLSLKVARQLRTERSSEKPKVVNEAGVFVFRVAGIFLDPEVKSFPESLTRPPQEGDVNIRKFVDKKKLVVVDLFGRLTFLTPQEWADLLAGGTKDILHPLIKIARHADLPPSDARVAEEYKPIRLTPPPTAMIVGHPDYLIYGGALMRLEGEIFRLEHGGVSYELRRRTIYRLLSEGRFAEAAQMVDGISDVPTLVKFFEDLVGGEAGEQNGYRNAEQFLHNTAVYAGKMFAELPAAKVAQIILLLYRHSRFQDQEALNQWLLLAFRAIRPKELLEEFSPALLGARARLPHLSTILGTLIEWEKTRFLAEILLKEGLEANHPASNIMYAAVDCLHEYDPSFAQPFDLQTNPDTKIFDKKRWAEKHRVVRKGRVIGPLVDRIAGPKAEVKRTPFDLPATSLAHRQEIYLRLREGLGKFLEEAESLEALVGSNRGLVGGGKKTAAISNLVLLSLPPEDVHRLLIEATKGKPFPISELLTHLLIHQPADIVLDYFKAWGADAADYEMEPISRAWVAIWNLGVRGEMLMAEVVALTLREDAASAVVQKLMNPFQDASEDVDVMADKIEMYKMLLENPNLREALNPYEIFEVTGVLRPGDLSGKFRQQAIGRAMKTLGDLDKFGKVNVPSRAVVQASGLGAIDSIAPTTVRNVPAPELAAFLSEDEQHSWRRRLADLLVQLKADEPEVVNYFAAQLESENEAKAKESFAVLNRLGPQAQQKLVAHIRRQATLKVPQRLPGAPLGGALKHLDVPTHKMVEVPISLKDLLQKFPITSSAMQTYIREQIFKADGPYVKAFKKDGHIDRIAGGEVETPAIIRELAAMGDAALILLQPFARGDTEILIEKRVRYHSAAAAISGWEEWQEFHPIFIPLLHLAELIGTPAAHQILADLYERIKTHKETEIRGGYFSAEHPIPQTPLRLIIRALARMEHKAGYTGSVAVEAHADFISRYNAGNPIEVTLAGASLDTFPDRWTAAKAIATAWGENNGSADALIRLFPLSGGDPLFEAIAAQVTSPRFYWDLITSLSKSFQPTGDVVRKIALDEDPNNHQRAIAIKTLFWCFVEVHSNAALIEGPQPEHAPDPVLQLLYTSGLAARYADPEDVKYFEAVFVKGPQ